uniref:Secreted protein n=1 Tax=Haemonchus placei TaxID=6290 RepID=A0A0N4VVX4_HAEPC
LYSFTRMVFQNDLRGNPSHLTNSYTITPWCGHIFLNECLSLWKSGKVAITDFYVSVGVCKHIYTIYTKANEPYIYQS